MTARQTTRRPARCGTVSIPPPPRSFTPEPGRGATTSVSLDHAHGVARLDVAGDVFPLFVRKLTSAAENRHLQFMRTLPRFAWFQPDTHKTAKVGMLIASLVNPKVASKQTARTHHAVARIRLGIVPRGLRVWRSRRKRRYRPIPWRSRLRRLGTWCSWLEVNPFVSLESEWVGTLR